MVTRTEDVVGDALGGPLRNMSIRIPFFLITFSWSSSLPNGWVGGRRPR